MDASRTAERIKRLRIEPVDDTRVRFVATLQDVSHGPDGEELIHSLALEGEVSLPDLVILSIVPTTLYQPHAECLASREPIAQLVGARIGPGFRNRVLEVLGRTRSCTHYLTLALDLAASHTLSLFLRMRAQEPFEGRNRPEGTWIGAGLAIEPRLENACIALASTSPVIVKARARGPSRRSG